LLWIEIGAVGMADREIVRANVRANMVGDADAADITITKRPARAHLGVQTIVVRLGVERDQADAAQVR
jgi:hypothetical protein